MAANLQHVGKGKCNNRSIVKTVLDMCKKSGIRTDGAITIPYIHVTEFSNGDQGVIVEIQTAANNDVWSRSAYKFVGKLWKRFPKAWVYPETTIKKGTHHNQYRIIIYTHWCDPD